MFKMDLLAGIITDARYFQKHRFKFKRPASSRAVRICHEHPPIPRIVWIESSQKYTAEFVREVTPATVTLKFIYTMNGKPATFQKINDSYKRMLVRRSLDGKVQEDSY